MSFPNFDATYKSTFRFLFFIDGIVGTGVRAKLPQKAARPSYSFKELDVQHLSEQIYFPGKIDYKSMSVTLYDDTYKNEPILNPVYNWILQFYNPKTGIYRSSTGGFKKNATITMYDGCGVALESWTYENAWPQEVNFGEVDMGTNDIMKIDLTLRFDRAYLIQESNC